MAGRRFAVLIASSQFPEDSRLDDLRLPENDVDGIYALLHPEDRGEFTSITVLKNRPSYEVLRTLNQVLHQADPDDLVFIYYSGHGKLNRAGQLHMATVDTNLDTLETTSLPAQTVKNLIEGSPSNRVVLVLDCCYAGAVGEAFARSSMDDQLQLMSAGRGTYILTSATDVQVALEKESDQYGVFTKHLIEGLQGGTADADGNGYVTMPEIYRYVRAAMSREGSQEPMQWNLNAAGDDLVLYRTGVIPWQQRRDQLRPRIVALRERGDLPLHIYLKALAVVESPPDQLAGVDRTYNSLLDRLLPENLRLGEFIDEWNLVGAEAAAGVPAAPAAPPPPPPPPEPDELPEAGPVPPLNVPPSGIKGWVKQQDKVRLVVSGVVLAVLATAIVLITQFDLNLPGGTEVPRQTREPVFQQEASDSSPTQPAAAPAAPEATQPAGPTVTGAAPVATATALPFTPTPAPVAVPEAIIPPSGAIRLGIPADPGSLNAFESCGTPSICDSLSDPLTWFDGETRELVPLSGISSWEQLDTDQWRFRLRSGVRFHNGEPWDAAAAKANIVMQGDPDNFTRSFDFTGPISAAAGDAEFDVVCQAACPSLPRLTAFNHFQAPQWYERASEEERRTRTIGFGPYQVVEWHPDESVQLAAYEDYNPTPALDGRMPSIAEATFYIVPDQAARIAAVQTGEFDWTRDVGLEQWQQLDRSPGITVKHGGSTEVFGGLFDTLWYPPLREVRVRRALLYAVDCESIVDRLYGGLSPCLGSLATRDTLGVSEKSAAPYPYNPGLAKQLLAEGGYPDGFKLQIITRSGRITSDVEASELIAQMWRDIGIDAEIRVTEAAIWSLYSRTGCGQYQDNPPDCPNRAPPPPLGQSPQVLMIAHSNPVRDFNRTASSYLDCYSIRSKVCEPSLQQLVEQSRSAGSTAELEQVLEELSLMAFEEALFLPLFEVPITYGLSDRLEWEPRFDGRVRLNTMSLGQ